MTRFAGIAACLMASVAVSACGGDGGAAQREREAAQERQEQGRRAGERAGQALERADEARELHAACSGQLGALVERLGELDSRLSVGLSYDEYTDEIGDLRVAYDKIDFDELESTGIGCLSQIGVPAEKALDRYARAAARWGECIEDFTCDTDALEPALQRRWSQATDFVGSAKDELDQLDDEANELELEAGDLVAAATQGGTEGLVLADGEDLASLLKRTVNEAAGDAVDTVTVEDTGRVGVYLSFGENAEAHEDEICDAIAKAPTNARAAIYQYHDRGQDTTYIVATCGTLKTP